MDSLLTNDAFKQGEGRAAPTAPNRTRNASFDGRDLFGCGRCTAAYHAAVLHLNGQLVDINPAVHAYFEGYSSAHVVVGAEELHRHGERHAGNQPHQGEVLRRP